MFATSVPEAVAEPHGRSSFAPVEEIGHPIHDKELNDYQDVNTVSSSDGYDETRYPRPTEEERTTLRKVADSIPALSYTLCVVEFAERASYYGVINIWSNFMQFPLPKGGNGAGAPPRGTQETAGALNKGLQFGNAFVLLFTFLAYVIPLFGAWLADTRLGRFKAVALGVFICGIAHVVLIIGVIPSILQAGHGIAPFLIAFFLLAFGAGMLLLVTLLLEDSFANSAQVSSSRTLLLLFSTSTNIKLSTQKSSNPERKFLWTQKPLFSEYCCFSTGLSTSVRFMPLRAPMQRNTLVTG